ncbi:MAG: YbhB/YbcL family Raf kinase inhibitor-like protein [Chloroflexi bacterium]|nr:YbhB/YbcL family Raf kinase inhibitor-like protein [Chloroflexota bacterium]
MPPSLGTVQAFALSSGAFAPGELLPLEYSCFGDNASPALDWAGTPSDAESLVLTVTDPDAPEPDFVHWLVYNIPANSTGLPPALPAVGVLDDGALQGTNDFVFLSTTEFASGAPVHVLGWDGPCPPEEHRYVFRLYALDTLLDLAPGATLVAVSEAMQGHVLAVAELEARFTPPR